MLAEEYFLLKSSYKVKLNKKLNKQVPEYIHNTLTEQKEILQVLQTFIHQIVQNAVEEFK